MTTPSPELPVAPRSAPSVAAPSCSYASCPDRPLLQWQRRPTAAELAPLVDAEQSRRDAALAAADQQQPQPEFGPLPSVADTTIAVFGCGPHALSMDLAALVHASNCTAPDPTMIPGCNCTPEQAPAPEPMHAEPQALPDH